jgi:hypothetical protein
MRDYVRVARSNGFDWIWIFLNTKGGRWRDRKSADSSIVLPIMLLLGLSYNNLLDG